MPACEKEPHYHLIVRLVNCSAGKEYYSGTIENDAMYAYSNEESGSIAGVVRDIINSWRDRKQIKDTTMASIEWRGETMDPNMLIRDICVNDEKIPLYICAPDDVMILKYWEL